MDEMMSYLEIHKKEVLGIFRIEEESVREDGDFPSPMS